MQYGNVLFVIFVNNRPVTNKQDKWQKETEFGKYKYQSAVAGTAQVTKKRKWTWNVTTGMKKQPTEWWEGWKVRDSQKSFFKYNPTDK
jgi:hypothetical protein